MKTLNTNRLSQKGSATLVLSIVLLAIISLSVLVASKSTIGLITTSANSYRSMQAQAAADAGLDFAVAYYLAGGADQDNNNTVDVLFPGNADGDGNENTGILNGFAVDVRFCTVNSLLPNCTAPTTNFNNVLILSRGFSDDRLGTHFVSQMMTYNQAMPNGPTAPLIAKSALSLKGSGNFAVYNNESNVTMWTGTDFNSLNGSLSTFININGVDDRASSTKSSGTFVLGPDVIHNDQNFKTATANEFFVNFFGEPITNFNSLERSDYIVNCSTSTTCVLPSGLNENKIIYINNPNPHKTTSVTLKIDQNLGSFNSVTNSYKPVLIIANGPVEFASNRDIYGVIYTTHVKKIAGGSTVYGSVIAEDAEDVQGTLNIRYRGAVVSTIENNFGARGSILSSWRDW